MLIEEYSLSVMKKAEGILKGGLCILEFPLTPEQIRNEKKLWRFFVKHGEDKRPNKSGFYTDVHGWTGNIVFWHMEKGHWTCSCSHYAFTGTENCKHILASRLIARNKIEEAKNEMSKM